MKDLIEREKAIEVVADEIWHYPNECYKNLNVFENAKDLAEHALRGLPSAQPNLQPTCNQLATDLISRQTAIDEIDEWIKAFLEQGHKESAADACLIQDGIIQLPSAQPGVINCKDCKYGVHAGRGDVYLCVVSPEERSEHIWDFWCAYAERRKDG